MDGIFRSSATRASRTTRGNTPRAPNKYFTPSGQFNKAMPDFCGQANTLYLQTSVHVCASPGLTHTQRSYKPPRETAIIYGRCSSTCFFGAKITPDQKDYYCCLSVAHMARIKSHGFAVPRNKGPRCVRPLCQGSDAG